MLVPKGFVLDRVFPFGEPITLVARPRARPGQLLLRQAGACCLLELALALELELELELEQTLVRGSEARSTPSLGPGLAGSGFPRAEPIEYECVSLRTAPPRPTPPCPATCRLDMLALVQQPCE